MSRRGSDRRSDSMVFVIVLTLGDASGHNAIVSYLSAPPLTYAMRMCMALWHQPQGWGGAQV